MSTSVPRTISQIVVPHPLPFSRDPLTFTALDPRDQRRVLTPHPPPVPPLSTPPSSPSAINTEHSQLAFVFVRPPQRPSAPQPIPTRRDVYPLESHLPPTHFCDTKTGFLLLPDSNSSSSREIVQSYPTPHLPTALASRHPPLPSGSRSPTPTPSHSTSSRHSTPPSYPSPLPPPPDPPRSPALCPPASFFFLPPRSRASPTPLTTPLLQGPYPSHSSPEPSPTRNSLVPHHLSPPRLGSTRSYRPPRRHVLPTTLPFLRHSLGRDPVLSDTHPVPFPRHDPTSVSTSETRASTRVIPTSTTHQTSAASDPHVLSSQTTSPLSSHVRSSSFSLQFPVKISSVLYLVPAALHVRCRPPPSPTYPLPPPRLTPQRLTT